MTHVFTICVDETVPTVEMLYMFLFLAPSAWLQILLKAAGVAARDGSSAIRG